MAYVSSLIAGEPLNYAFMEGNGEFITRVAIGYDDAANETYSLFVALSPMAGYPVGHLELIFRVIKYSGDDASYADYHDGLITKAFIPNRYDRGLIQIALHACIEALIDEAAPKCVSVVTYEANLPEAALEKFHKISALFAHKGYEVGQADPYHGQHIWMMCKNDDHEV